MKKSYSILLVLTVSFILSSFVSQNSSVESWLVGHFKGSVDIGNGDQAVYFHVLNTTDNVKTVIDNEIGIGCTEEWTITPKTNNAVFLSNNSSGPSCLNTSKIKLVDDGNDSFMAYFYNSAQDGAFASALFTMYAEVD